MVNVNFHKRSPGDLAQRLSTQNLGVANDILHGDLLELACFAVFIRFSSSLSFNWRLPLNDYNFPNISLDITIFSTSLVPS